MPKIVPPVETPAVSESLQNLIQTEKAYLKDATALVTDEESLKFFKESKKHFQTAEGLVDDVEKQTLIYYQYVNLRNKVTFLLFRTNALTKELEERFRSLQSIEEVAKLVEDSAKPRLDAQAKCKEEVTKLQETEQKLDIFKAVCNGMSVEQAQEQLKAYEEQLKQAMPQK